MNTQTNIGFTLSSFKSTYTFPPLICFNFFFHPPICFLLFFFRIYRFLLFLYTSGESAWTWKSPMNWGTFITVSWRNFDQIKKSYLHLGKRKKNGKKERRTKWYTEQRMSQFFFLLSNKLVPLFLISTHLSWISKLFILSNQKRTFYLSIFGVLVTQAYFFLLFQVFK